MSQSNPFKQWWATVRTGGPNQEKYILGGHVVNNTYTVYLHMFKDNRLSSIVTTMER
jgi:hypothetical protein